MLSPKITMTLGIGLLLSSALGQQPCATGMAVGISVSLEHARVGQKIIINGMEVFLSSNTCAVTNGKAWIIFPDNTATLWLDNFAVAPGGSIYCPGTDSCMGSFSYTVSSNDIDRSIQFETNYPVHSVVGCTIPSSKQFIRFMVVASAYSVGYPSSYASACAYQGVEILYPRFTNSVASQSGVILSGIGGLAYSNYVVLASAQILSPNWTPILTNTFGADGGFMFTNRASEPQQFYKLSAQ